MYKTYIRDFCNKTHFLIDFSITKMIFLNFQFFSLLLNIFYNIDFIFLLFYQGILLNFVFLIIIF